MDNKELIYHLQKKWEELYAKVRTKDISNVEYAQRRKAYIEIIGELSRVEPQKASIPFCTCEKPWGVGAVCIVCGKPIEILY